MPMVCASGYLSARTLHQGVSRQTACREFRAGKGRTPPGFQGPVSRVREAAVHNYIFVRSTREVIDDLKTFRLPILRYVMHQQNGENQIMTVPDSQMRNFIAVAANIDEPVIFLSPEEVALSKGDKVRIKDGVFMGVEGTFMRVKNTRDRRVVVKIDGITAVATASIPSALVEKI